MPGDGAAMVQPPDAPVDFANNPAITSATNIGLQWSRGLSDGGKDVIDHTVSYDQGINKFIVLESGIVGTSYTSPAMTPGTTYKFKVQARNSVGLSSYSEEISILAAQVPNQP